MLLDFCSPMLCLHIRDEADHMPDQIGVRGGQQLDGQANGIVHGLMRNLVRVRSGGQASGNALEQTRGTMIQTSGQDLK